MKTGRRYQLLNRDVIKGIAMLTMFLNHFAHVFLSAGALHDALTYIGYFTAPVMCYFLVEGFEYTRDRRVYLLRLIVMAFLSQPFYDNALEIGNMNMMFTLAVCFCILECLEKLRPWPLTAAAIFVLLVASCAMDWMVMAPVFVMLVYAGRRSGVRNGVPLAYLACYVFYVWFVGPGGFYSWDIRDAAVSGLGILAAGVCVGFLYNGRRADVPGTAQKGLQAFFYVFYPAHLAVLWLASAGL